MTNLLYCVPIVLSAAVFILAALMGELDNSRGNAPPTGHIQTEAYWHKLTGIVITYSCIS